MNIKLRWLFAYLGFFLLFLSLGAWQINRANQKQAFLDAQAQRQNQAVQINSEINANLEELRYRPASVVGHFETQKQFLLDNQIDAGKVGYFVFTPFKLQNSTKSILVNRGWIPLIEPRAILPNVDFQAETTETILQARINSFPSIGLKLAGANQPTTTNPAVVGIIDTNVLAKELGYELFAFQLELAPEMPNGFKRDWKAANIMQPEQHLAYAMQWFGLALVLTILFIKFGVFAPQK